jgi:hypothetical protein
MKLMKIDLLNAVEKESMLTNFGIGIPSATPKNKRKEIFQKERESLKKNFEQFQVCCEWLSLCRRRKTINTKIGTSYGLKHRVEKHFGKYVTNGAFIAAVIHLGIPYKIATGSPNIKVALSSSLPPISGTKV